MAEHLFNGAMRQTEHFGTAAEAWWMWKQRYTPTYADGQVGNSLLWQHVYRMFTHLLPSRELRHLSRDIERSSPWLKDEGTIPAGGPTARRRAWLSLPLLSGEEHNSRIRVAFLNFNDSAKSYWRSQVESIARFARTLQHTRVLSQSDVYAIDISPPDVPAIIAHCFRWADYQVTLAKRCAAFTKLGRVVCQAVAGKSFTLRGDGLSFGAYNFLPSFTEARVTTTRKVETIEAAVQESLDACHDLVRFFEGEHDRFVKQLPGDATEACHETDILQKEEQAGNPAAASEPAKGRSDVGERGGSSVEQETESPVHTPKSRVYKAVIGLLGEQYTVTSGSKKYVIREKYTRFFGLFVCNAVKNEAAAIVPWEFLNQVSDPAKKEVEKQKASPRTLAWTSKLNKGFADNLGPGPAEPVTGDIRWIVGDKGEGYHLNREVHWKVGPSVEKLFKARRQGQDYDWDPVAMGRAFSNRDDDESDECDATDAVDNGDD
jgi:hypothetical protein